MPDPNAPERVWRIDRGLVAEFPPVDVRAREQFVEYIRADVAAQREREAFEAGFRFADSSDEPLEVAYATWRKRKGER